MTQEQKEKIEKAYNEVHDELCELERKEREQHYQLSDREWQTMRSLLCEEDGMDNVLYHLGFWAVYDPKEQRIVIRPLGE